jgi:hypothetical protein
MRLPFAGLLGPQSKRIIQTMLKKHYREVVTKEAAAKYREIQLTKA